MYSNDKESDDISAEVKRICRVKQFTSLSLISLGVVCVPVSRDPEIQGLAYSCSCSVGSIHCVLICFHSFLFEWKMMLFLVQW